MKNENVYHISVLKGIGEIGYWIVINKNYKLLVQFPIRESEEAVLIFELLSAMMDDLNLKKNDEK